MASGGISFIQPARGAESSSVYGQLNYDLTDNLVVTAGVRYTDDLKYDRGGRNIMVVIMSLSTYAGWL